MPRTRWVAIRTIGASVATPAATTAAAATLIASSSPSSSRLFLATQAPAIVCGINNGSDDRLGKMPTLSRTISPIAAATHVPASGRLCDVERNAGPSTIFNPLSDCQLHRRLKRCRHV